MRGWAWLLTGAVLVAISIALHVLAAANVSGTDPLTADLATIARQGWVRLAAWAALSGGAFLVVAGWSQRIRSREISPGSVGTD